MTLLPRTRAFLTATVLSCLLGIPALQAQSLEEAAEQVVRQLTENLTAAPLEVEITTLTLEGTKASSPFADQFLDRVREEMRDHPGDYPKVARRDVQPEALSRGISIAKPNFSSADAQVEDAVLEGTYREAGDRLFVALRLVREDGSSISQAEAPVALDQLNVAFKPEAVSVPDLQAEEAELEDLLALPQELPLTAQLAKGDGATYYSGDAFEVMLRSEEAAYIRLIYRDVNGTTTELYESPGPLAAGQTHLIPPRRNGRPQWQIACDSGCGPETVVVVASTEPLPQATATRGFGSGDSWALGSYLRDLFDALPTRATTPASRGLNSPGSAGNSAPAHSLLVLHLTTAER